MSGARRKGEFLINGYKISVMGDEQVLEICCACNIVPLDNNTVLFTERSVQRVDLIVNCSYHNKILFLKKIMEEKAEG